MCVCIYPTLTGQLTEVAGYPFNIDPHGNVRPFLGCHLGDLAVAMVHCALSKYTAAE